MARSRPGRRSTSDLLSKLTDDVKDFIDDEIVDRAGVAEREVRRAGRRLTDERRRLRTAGEDRGEIDELKCAVAELTEKVERLVDARKSARSHIDDKGRR